MNILKMQRKIVKFLETIGRERNQSPSINQMTMVMLVYREKATTYEELSKVLKKTNSSIRKLSDSLMDGRGSCHKSGFGFLKATPFNDPNTSGKPKHKLSLTKDGKKFARIIAPFFGD